MQAYDIHEAKKLFSRLVEAAAKGESFVIAKAGKPLVKVVPFDESVVGKTRRLDFMVGEIAVSDDFDRMGSEEIGQFFLA